MRLGWLLGLNILHYSLGDSSHAAKTLTRSKEDGGYPSR